MVRVSFSLLNQNTFCFSDRYEIVEVSVLRVPSAKPMLLLIGTTDRKLKNNSSSFLSNNTYPGRLELRYTPTAETGEDERNNNQESIVKKN